MRARRGCSTLGFGARGPIGRGGRREAEVRTRLEHGDGRRVRGGEAMGKQGRDESSSAWGRQGCADARGLDGGRKMTSPASHGGVQTGPLLRSPAFRAASPAGRAPRESQVVAAALCAGSGQRRAGWSGRAGRWALAAHGRGPRRYVAPAGLGRGGSAASCGVGQLQGAAGSEGTGWKLWNGPRAIESLRIPYAHRRSSHLSFPP